MTEDEMVGWHQRLNRHEFERPLGDSEGQRSLVCCSAWGHRVRHDLAIEQQYIYMLSLSLSFSGASGLSPSHSSALRCWPGPTQTLSLV